MMQIVMMEMTQCSKLACILLISLITEVLSGIGNIMDTKKTNLKMQESQSCISDLDFT